MLHLIKKIILSFSWNRKDSDNLNLMNKGSQGNVLTNTGDHCSLQMATGDINNYFPLDNQNLIEKLEAWNALQLFFSRNGSSQLIEIVKDPRNKAHFDRNIGGWKKCLTEHFKKIHFLPKSPNEWRFIEIQKEVLSAADTFIKTTDEIAFLETWASCKEALASIKDSELAYPEDNKPSKR